MTSPTSPESQSDESIAREIIRPYLEKKFGESNFVSIDTLRKTFLATGHQLPHFTRGLKYLLDNKLIKRVNDHELTLTTTGQQFAGLKP